MTTFTIDTENSITALTNQEVVAGIPDGAMPFTSDRELLPLRQTGPPSAWSKSGTAFPASRL